MEPETFARIMRGNWHSISLLVVIVGTGVWMSLTPEDSISVSAAPVAAVDDEASQRQREVAAAIAHYEDAVKFNRGNVETPDNLFRLASLYMTGVSDYENAVLYFEALVQEYPNHARSSQAYPMLLTCYEKLENDELRHSTLRRMMDHFEPGSENYLFAKQELGL